MIHLSAVVLALLAKVITSAPLSNVQDYTYEIVGPEPEFSIKVPNQLYITMCRDIDFGPPCDGGYVAPGLCYAVPSFGGVSSVQPSNDISGCKLYQGTPCDTTGGNIPDVAYPGIADLREYGLNDDINSFICY